MQADTLILGYGPVGRATAALLQARGERVTIAQRRRPDALGSGLGFAHCDILDAASVDAAVARCSQLVLAVGFPYDRGTWLRDWPIAMRNVLAACGRHQVRMVFLDNLYMYGPQDAPLVETMPLSQYGGKPRARAEVTRLWQAAASEGAVRIAALRAPDFYGPGVTLSHLGESGFGAVATGKTAMLVAPPDTQHDFAYVPDIAANIVTLLDAPDDCYGQAWHTPCAPTLTPRGILDLGAAALGKRARIRAIPLWALPLVGAVMPFARELVEMRFQWDRPYRVDASKWHARFGGTPTPFEEGAAVTARSFAPSA